MCMNVKMMNCGRLSFLYIEPLDLLVVEVDCGHEANAELAGSPAVPVDRSHTTARKEDRARDGLLSAAGVVRRALPGEDGVVCQCALVGDS
jgi:hypothetical protein